MAPIPCISVCLSVTSRCPVKAAKHIITQCRTMPADYCSAAKYLDEIHARVGLPMGPRPTGSTNTLRVRKLYDCLQIPGYNKGSAVAEMGDRGHNRHGPKIGGSATFWRRGSWLPIYNVASAEAYFPTKWHLDPSSHSATTEILVENWGLCPFGEGIWLPI